MTPTPEQLAERIAREHFAQAHMIVEYPLRTTLGRAVLAAIIETTEAAAELAESDDLILSESRSAGSFGRARKDHGELVASRLRANEHLKGRP